MAVLTERWNKAKLPDSAVIGYRGFVRWRQMKHSLRIRLVAIIVTTLLICFTCAAIPLVLIVSSNFDNQRTANMLAFAKSIALHIEEDMLSGDAQHVTGLVQALEVVSEFDMVRILRTDGSEAFSDLTILESVNRKLGFPSFTRNAREKVQIIPEDDPFLRKAVSAGKAVTFTDSATGRSTLLSPIKNKPECSHCHESDNPIRGVVMVSGLNGKDRAAVFSF